MNKLRAVLSGIISWALIFASFAIMSFVPGLKDSETYQHIVLCIVLIPIVIVGARYYYKKGDKTNGLITGLVMVLSGLIMDALVVVPLVVIPQGGSYTEFFSRPFEWIVVMAYVLIVYVYYRMKIK